MALTLPWPHANQHWQIVAICHSACAQPEKGNNNNLISDKQNWNKENKDLDLKIKVIHLNYGAQDSVSLHNIISQEIKLNQTKAQHQTGLDTPSTPKKTRMLLLL